MLSEHRSHPESVAVIAHLADIYAELGLYENALVLWYKFLLRANKSDYWEAYNGLGANFYFLERYNLAGYYFNEQLREREDPSSVYEEVLEEYIEKLNADGEKKRFTVLKKQTEGEKAQEVIERARKLNGANDSDLAIKILSEIPKENPKYGLALYEIGVSHLFKGDIDLAMENISKSIENGNSSVNAISIMIDLIRSTGVGGEDKYLKMLTEYQPADDDDKYKKLTALCEYELDEFAVKLADELLKNNPYDTNTAYIKGFLCYNKARKDVLPL